MPRHSAANDKTTDTFIGQQLRRIRLMHGLSQVNVAEEAGISFQQLQKYEHGTNRVSASRLMLLAKILKCTVAELFPADGELPDEHPASEHVRHSAVNAKIFELVPHLTMQQRTTLLQIATSFAAVEQNPGS